MSDSRVVTLGRGVGPGWVCFDNHDRRPKDTIRKGCATLGVLADLKPRLDPALSVPGAKDGGKAAHPMDVRIASSCRQGGWTLGYLTDNQTVQRRTH